MACPKVLFIDPTTGVIAGTVSEPAAILSVVFRHGDGRMDGNGWNGDADASCGLVNDLDADGDGRQPHGQMRERTRADVTVATFTDNRPELEVRMAFAATIDWG